jgi:hypothetical protein
MSRGNWLSDIANTLGLGAIFALVVWTGCQIAVGVMQGDPPSRGQQREPSLGEAETYCTKLETRNECIIQLRTATATEQQAHYAKSAVWIGGFALLSAVVAAAAALWTVWRMKDTAERQLRAYVAVTPNRLVGLSPTGRPHLTYRLTNFGETPAHGMSHAAILEILPHPLVDNYRFPDLSIEERPSKSVLWRDTPMPYIAHHYRFASFAKEEIIELLEGKDGGGCRLYVFGQVDYWDAFKRKHWTRFCWSLEPQKAELIALAKADNWDGLAKATLGTWELAGQHNETDYD